MSSANLKAVQISLEQLPELDCLRELLEVLTVDIAAAHAGFSPCLVAPDTSSLADLQKVFPAAQTLLPFNKVVEWTLSDQLLLERANILIAATTARQLLPNVLIDAMNAAAKAGTPVALLVRGMDRIGAPKAVAAGVGKQLDEVLPNTRKTHICLGDSRYPGPSLEEAATRILMLQDLPEKDKALASLRAKQAQDALIIEFDKIKEESDHLREHISLNQQQEHVSMTLAKATASVWLDYFYLFEKVFSTIVPKGIISEAKQEYSEQALVQATAEYLREHVARSLKSTADEYKTLVIEELDQLVRKIKNDIQQSMNTLDTFGHSSEQHSFNFDNMDNIIQNHLNMAISEALAALDTPSTLSSFWTLIQPILQSIKSSPTDSSDSISEEEAGEILDTIKNIPINTPLPQIKPPAKSGDSTSGAPFLNRLEPLLNSLSDLPEQMLEKQLASAFEDSLHKSKESARRSINQTVSVFQEQLPANVAKAYIPLHEAGRCISDHKSRQLDLLTKALRTLQEIKKAHGTRAR